MRRLAVFNSLTLDGYFTGADGDMSWAHRAAKDPEFEAFVEGNAKSGGALVFGRVTYEMMAGWWPTPAALKAFPVVAERMNAMPKFVFSRSMKQAAWSNTTILHGDPVAEIRRLKEQPGEDLAIMGSGSIVAPLAGAGLIDEYQIVRVPVVLGRGRTMFDGLGKRLDLELKETRAFANGSVFLRYQPSGAKGSATARGLVPILNVSDIQASFAWFEKLGWRKEWDWGTPVTFGGVVSGDCTIFLCLNGQGGRGKSALPITSGEAEAADKGVWMTIWVDDVDAMHRRCVEQGLEVTAPPQDKPWNTREMHLRHPDGHVFRISRGFEET